MIEKPEGEQNEASKKAETGKWNENEGDIPEEAPEAMPAAGGKKKSGRRNNDWSLIRAKSRKVTRHLENQAGKERR